MKKMRVEKQWALSGLGVSDMLYPMLKNIYRGILFVALAQVTVGGTVANMSALPPPPYADLEVSADAAMPLPERLTRTFKLTLSLDATATNNAEVVFGTGACDSPDNTSIILGFDRGTWGIRGNGLRQKFTIAANNPSAAVRRSLTAQVRLDADGAPVVVKLDADGQPVTFAGLTVPTLLSWLDPRGWESFRVMSRGGADNVTASVKFLADGSVFILR